MLRGLCCAHNLECLIEKIVVGRYNCINMSKVQKGPLFQGETTCGSLLYDLQVPMDRLKTLLKFLYIRGNQSYVFLI